MLMHEKSRFRKTHYGEEKCEVTVSQFGCQMSSEIWIYCGYGAYFNVFPHVFLNNKRISKTRTHLCTGPL